MIIIAVMMIINLIESTLWTLFLFLIKTPYELNLYNFIMMKLSKLKPTYDIVIVGAGVPGSSLAAALKSSPLFETKNCLIIDSAPRLP